MNLMPTPEPDPDPDLHAYLDDQLEPGARALVEQGIAASPLLRARMRDLERVRDLVATLPRADLDVDLSARVVAAIATSARRQRMALRFAMAGTSVATAIAASLLVVFGWPRARPDAPLAGSPAASVAWTPNEAMPPVVSPAATIEVAATVASAPSTSVIPDEVAVDPAALADAQRRKADHERLQALLKMGPTREITIVVDRIEPSSFGALEDAIRRSNRKVPEHARVAMTQTVRGGEDGRDAKVVYALAMDDVELANFRRKLEERFPKSVSDPDEEHPATAEALASLGDVGSIEIREGEPRSTLMPPPVELAMKSDIRQPKSSVAREQLVGPNGQVIAVERRDADPQLVARSRITRVPAAVDLPVAVYLVWIRPRDGRG